MTSRAYRHSLNGSTLPAGAPQLEVSGVRLRFGGVKALDDVTLQVRQGEVHAVVGPNGAGKSSLLNCISGLYRPQPGSIRLHNGGWHELTRTAPSRIARLGVARSFQNIELFTHLTVLENLMLGRHMHMRPRRARRCSGSGRRAARRSPTASSSRRSSTCWSSRRSDTSRWARCRTGIQKRVELGRALCLQPALLLLDEPMAGMNAEEKEDMARYILDVARARRRHDRAHRARHGRRHGHLPPA